MKLSINGKSVDVAAKAETPMLYVLRNDLGLVGSRFGCGSHNRVVRAVQKAAHE